MLTGLAGLSVGVAAMRVWQTGQVSTPAEAGVAHDGDPSGEAGQTPAWLSTWTHSSRLLLAGAAVLVALAGAVMLIRSPEDATTGPVLRSLAPAGAAAGTQTLDDVDTMIGRLSQRLQANPKDGEGFRMLGWSYAMTGHPEKALQPYRRALELLPDNALVHSGYAEALTGVAGGKVDAQAKREFEKALALDPAEPRTRYFLALWKAQNGQEKSALEEWIALANSGPADASWQGDVRRQITQVAAKLKVDVTGRLTAPAATAPSVSQPQPVDAAAMQAAAALPPGERQAMIAGMVEGLAKRLKDNPQDGQGWARLLHSRMVLGQGEQAAQELVAARKALARDPAGLAQVNDAASQSGVPGA
ncbi:hypothetical protein [Novosphingobium sp. CF614]|uniref:tetratricopeptide repeat protein n=1 Tax=Novosphingobium sp. CF614 TaxID=1884364 RepID=UPI0011603694|nr:hypothetical protein [Novosphingobium sp. CF614]